MRASGLEHTSTPEKICKTYFLTCTTLPLTDAFFMYEFTSHGMASCWPPPTMPRTKGLRSAEPLHQACGTFKFTAEYITIVLTAWQDKYACGARAQSIVIACMQDMSNYLTQAEQVQAGIHIRAAEPSIEQDLGMPSWVQDGLKLKLWCQLRKGAACVLSLRCHPFPSNTHDPPASSSNFVSFH